MEYQVTGKVGGKRIIKFNCPTCNIPIESPLKEAGQRFPCPSCGREFLTPGIEELEQEQEAVRKTAAVEHMTAARWAKMEAQAERIATEQGRKKAEADAPGPVAMVSPEVRRYVAGLMLPEYVGISVGASALRIFSGVAVGAACFSALRLIGGVQETVIASLALILGYLAVAAFFYLLASLSVAIRDIARNSFR